MRLSSARVKVIREFLTNREEEQYGFGLMRATGVQAGSLYPILERFEREGWIESYEELIDEHIEGRPRRRLYRLTSAKAAQEAEEAVKKFYLDLGIPETVIPRLRGI